MKKVALICLSFIYLVFSTGYSVNLHFCGGDFQSISLIPSAKDCNKCGKKSMKRCCKDVSASFQAEDDHSKLNSKISIKAPNLAPSFLQQSNFFIYHFNTQSTQSYYFSESKPYSACIPIYIQNCTFLI